MVEATGVELINVLTAARLLILRMARRPKKARLPIPLYEDPLASLESNNHRKPSIPHFAAVEEKN